MRKIIAVTVLSLMLFGVGSVNANADGITLQRFLDCGSWLEARATQSPDAPEHFVTGFLNGMALEGSFNFWLQPYEITEQQAFLWLDKYCRENPLKSGYTGLVTLFNQRKTESFGPRK